MRSSVSPGARLVLDMEKPAAGGWMIARNEGQVILVSGAIPGERALVEVTRVARGVAYGHVREVIDAVPERRGTADENPCGGTVLAHIAYAAQVAIKAAIITDTFSRVARLPLPGPVAVMGSREDGYRMRARLHVSNGRIGFYRERTYQLCDPASTGQLLDAALSAIRSIESALARWDRPQPATVEIVESLPGDQRILHLEFEGPSPPVETLRGLRGPGVDGLTYTRAGSRLSRSAHGARSVQDEIEISDGGAVGRFRIERRPGAFFQANRYLFVPLLQRVVESVGDGKAVDLYAGVGGFGLALAALGRGPVTAVESDPVAAEDLRLNAASWPGLRLAVMSVEEYLEKERVPPGVTVVLDPPRTGMSRRAQAALLSCRPRRIVYVSCDAATLARDATHICAAGYELVSLEGFDLFPGTAHVEALAVFTAA